MKKKEYATLSAGVSAGDTTFPINDGEVFKNGDTITVFKVSTGATETVRVNATPNANNISVDRGLGGTTAIAFLTDDILINRGGSFASGGNFPEALHIISERKYGYVEFLRQIYKINGRQMNRDMDTGDSEEEQIKTGLREIMYLREKKFFHGTPDSIATNTGPLTMSDGILNVIDTNNIALSSLGDSDNDMSELEFEDFMVISFRHASQKGMPKLFTSSEWMLGRLNSFGRGRIDTRVGGTKMGFKLDQYIHTSGTLNLVPTDNLWHYDSDNMYDVYGGMGVVIDPNNVERKYFKGRDMAFKRYEKPDVGDGFDGVIGEWTVDDGWKIKHEKTHAKLTAVQGVE